jgi:hypothetical protein
VSGPDSVQVDEISTYADTTGKKLKSSGVSIAALATTSQLAGKVTAVPGKGLSTNDYTNADKAKLSGLRGNFRGSFASDGELSSETFNPPPAAGDFVLIEAIGSPVSPRYWDDTNDTWSPIDTPPLELTAAEIATLLFNEGDAEDYDKELCRIFTQGDKANLDILIGLVDNLGGLIPTYGACHYFSLTGSVTSVSSTTDGVNNLVKIGATTTFDTSSVGFDAGSPSASNRLRYTGTVERTFKVTASISTGGDIVGDTLVFAIFKNGSLVSTGRAVEDIKSPNEIGSVTISCVVPLDTNDYVEVFVGNATDTDDPKVYSLSLNAVAI